MAATKLLKALLGLCVLALCADHAPAQNIEGQIIASQYGRWKVPGYAPNSYSGFAPTSCRVQGGASFFFAFRPGTPLLLVDSNPALTETVTPTATVDSNVSCAVTIAPVNDHQLPFYLTSGTGGLQEALNENLTNPLANTVILDNAFYQSAGSADRVATLIATAQGNYQLGLEDVTQVPTAWYAWNGTQYVRVGNGGVGTGLNTLQNDLVANNASNTAAEDLYDFVATGAYSAQAAIDAAAAHNGSAMLQPGVGRSAFHNTGNVRVVDQRTDVPATARSVTEFGAACDVVARAATFSAGSKAISIGLLSMDASYVGRWVVATGAVGGVPTVFASQVATVVDGTHATVTTNFPFSQATAHAVLLGHDDTAAIAQGLAAVGAGGTLVFPEGNCLTHQQTLAGQSPIGLGPQSAIYGMPGEDIFRGQDPSTGTGGSQGNAHIHDLTLALNERIDATLPWQLQIETTLTAQTPMYRPILRNSAAANNPLAPGWFVGAGPHGSGAYNGVASIASGSAVMCVPAAETAPAVAQTVVFPYLANVFTATVASAGGSCASGLTARTLTSPLPAGATQAQAEWMAGTAPQALATAIGAGTCPATITVAQSLQPAPGYESNVAGKGLIKIDGEQFAYKGATVAANAAPDKTFYHVACAQNGTARAAHATGATVVPLNPFQPSYPWPVIPSINPGDTTPAATAGFFPGENAGNQAFAFPVASGAQAGTGASGSWSGGVIEHLTFVYYPGDVNFANPNPWAAYNRGGAMYFVQLPYSTKFRDLYVEGLYSGFTEGVPSVENGNWGTAQPTADGTSWDNVQVHGAYPVVMVAGNENSYENFNVYSSEGAGPNNAAETLGADICYYFTAELNDQTGGQVEESSLNHHKNFYCEPETGANAGIFPTWEFDMHNAELHDMHMGGGGEVRIGGNAQHFYSGNFNNNPADPAINYGYGNTADYVQNLGGGAKGNIYGVHALIDFGDESSFTGQVGQAFSTSTGPYGPLAVGSRAPMRNQTAETFTTGNVTAPYVSTESGFVRPSEFNLSGSFEPNPMSVYAFDDLAPLTHHYVGCNVGGDSGFTYCLAYRFNQDGIYIGKEQRLVPGKYEVYLAARDLTAATNTITLGLGSDCRLLSGFAYFHVPVTNAWGPLVDLGAMDFSADTNQCRLAVAVNGATTADQLQVSLLAFAPFAQTLNTTTLNVTNINTPSGPNGGNANGCAQSPVTGINGGYTCPTKGWVGSLAAAQGIGDTAVTLNTTANLSPSGCFFVDGEYECYTAIAGNTLTGLTRGAYVTTAAAHGNGATAVSVNLVLGSVQQAPLEVIAYGGSEAPILGINNPTPYSHGGSSVLAINAGNNETWVDTAGALHQENTSVVSQFQGSLLVGVYPRQPAIVNTGNVVQINGPTTDYAPFTLGGGHAGSLEVTATPTIAAPSILPSVSPGTSTVSYVCAGTDFDGNPINGTTATVTNGAASWAYPNGYEVECPWTAGVNTFQIYRTAGGVNQGLMASGVGPGFILHDYGDAATAGTPPAANGSDPHIAVAGTGNPTISLGSAGPKIFAAAGSPPSGCGSGFANGSLFLRTDGSVAGADLLYVCDAGTSSWVDVK